MGLLRRFVAYLLFGALSGDGIATFIARKFWPWYSAPGNDSGKALCPCQETALGTVDSLVRAQLIGALVGMCVMLVVGFFVEHAVWTRARARRAPPSSPVPGSPPG